MDIFLIIKAGFMGFALCLGVLFLVFFLVGFIVRVTEKNFARVFILAALASFVAIDLFLYYKIVVSRVPGAPIFLAGSVGGWLAGITSGLTNMKRFLTTLRK
jgi:uncharacterized protein with PQ loop repeat